MHELDVCFKTSTLKILKDPYLLLARRDSVMEAPRKEFEKHSPQSNAKTFQTFSEYLAIICHIWPCDIFLRLDLWGHMTGSLLKKDTPRCNRQFALECPSGAASLHWSDIPHNVTHGYSEWVVPLHAPRFSKAPSGFTKHHKNYSDGNFACPCLLLLLTASEMRISGGYWPLLQATAWIRGWLSKQMLAE